MFLYEPLLNHKLYGAHTEYSYKLGSRTRLVLKIECAQNFFFKLVQNRVYLFTLLNSRSYHFFLIRLCKNSEHLVGGLLAAAKSILPKGEKTSSCDNLLRRSLLHCKVERDRLFDPPTGK